MSDSRKISIVTLGGFRPTKNPTASHFGLTPLALPGETWPMDHGDPMMFVCQLNLTNAPAVPALLADLQLLTLFVNPEASEMKQENGKGWQLRAYRSLDGLAPLRAPAGAPAIRQGFECKWEEGIDYPPENDDDDGQNVSRTKIGGYSSDIQSEPWWESEAHPADPKFCLQINSEEKVSLMWGDAGSLYIARGTAPGFEDKWFLDWQCF